MEATGPLGKVRSPVTVILLTLVTLGIYLFFWIYYVFKELKDHTSEGIGGVIGLVIALVIGVVNLFVLPSEIGNMYDRGRSREAGQWGHGVLEPDPADRMVHLDGEGPERV